MTDYYDEDGTVITEDMQTDMFDQYLDELHDEVTIGDITFSPSKILAECDPIAYRCYASDYESAQIENGEWFEDDPTEDEEEDEDDTDWEQYWEDYDNGKIKAEDRKDGMFRN